MNTINRLMVNIITHDLAKSKDFYTTLFDFTVDYDSDWFVHLISNRHQWELGLMSATSDMVPAGVAAGPGGFYPTFVVDNVDAVFAIAQEKNLSVVAPPEDTFYGQRRLILKDPAGAVIDVSSPTASAVST